MSSGIRKEINWYYLRLLLGIIIIPFPVIVTLVAIVWPTIYQQALSEAVVLRNQLNIYGARILRHHSFRCFVLGPKCCLLNLGLHIYLFYPWLYALDYVPACNDNIRYIGDGDIQSSALLSNLMADIFWLRLLVEFREFFLSIIICAALALPFTMRKYLKIATFSTLLQVFYVAS